MPSLIAHESLLRNRLLATLSTHARDRLLPLLTIVSIDVGQSLYHAGSSVPAVYFPVSAVFSHLKYGGEDGRKVEVATVGNEGFIGLLLDDDHIPTDSIARIGGAAVSISVDNFLLALHEDEGELHRVLLRFAEASFNQVALNVACNRSHPIDKRCACWLLMTQDRVQQDEFILTDEFLSDMVAASREDVPAAKQTLAQTGLIRYVGAKIHILDRQRLEEASCECYSTIKREEDRLLG